ncbi:hypothetical protein GZ212_13035 [Mangrovimonas sp. CR14]|uniref:hypothetical protein n=1 Tax=Mangrovimonas sp. CR14 TaxID=2706120 RepID=UPI00141FD5EB|nr:hypothetical protein [Mangrovimonas sp. CR14]NIK93081.1 hypothetical protein [Mangrovimonas sp. CR14]
MDTKFYIGVLLTILGLAYTVYNAQKESVEELFKKISLVNSWFLGIYMIIIGVILLLG